MKKTIEAPIKNKLRDKLNDLSVERSRLASAPSFDRPSYEKVMIERDCFFWVLNELEKA